MIRKVSIILSHSVSSGQIWSPLSQNFVIKIYSVKLENQVVSSKGKGLVQVDKNLILSPRLLLLPRQEPVNCLVCYGQGLDWTGCLHFSWLHVSLPGDSQGGLLISASLRRSPPWSCLGSLFPGQCLQAFEREWLLRWEGAPQTAESITGSWTG